jgi:hypothetical protein
MMMRRVLWYLVSLLVVAVTVSRSLGSGFWANFVGKHKKKVSQSSVNQSSVFFPVVDRYPDLSLRQALFLEALGGDAILFSPQKSETQSFLPFYFYFYFYPTFIAPIHCDCEY